jgi:hypothetical protein
MFTKSSTLFCKGIGIFLMLFHHLFYNPEEYAGFALDFRPFTAERLTFLALLCKVCVALFVFLSAYGLTAKYRETFSGRKTTGKEIGSFIWKRYLKLMLSYWFVFALVLILQPLGRSVFQVYGSSPKDIFLFLGIDALGLSYFFRTPTLNATWWYMSIAILLLFLLPFILELMKRMGSFPVLAAGTLLPFFFDLQNASTFYLFSMLLGAFCYEEHIFEKIENAGSRHRWSRPAKLAAEIFLLLLLFSYRTNYSLNGITDGLIALDIALITGSFLVKIPVLSPIMQSFGRQSANIFLTHTMLYSYYFKAFFYSFQFWPLIWAVLLLASWLLSVLIELLKKAVGYRRLLRFCR